MGSRRLGVGGRGGRRPGDWNKYIYIHIYIYMYILMYIIHIYIYISGFVFLERTLCWVLSGTRWYCKPVLFSTALGGPEAVGPGAGGCGAALRQGEAHGLRLRSLGQGLERRAAPERGGAGVPGSEGRR